MQGLKYKQTYTNKPTVDSYAINFTSLPASTVGYQILYFTYKKYTDLTTTITVPIINLGSFGTTLAIQTYMDSTLGTNASTDEFDTIKVRNLQTRINYILPFVKTTGTVITDGDIIIKANQYAVINSNKDNSNYNINGFIFPSIKSTNFRRD